MERRRVLDEQVHVAQQRFDARMAETHSIADDGLGMEQTHEQQTRIAQTQDETAKEKPVIAKLSAEKKELAEKIPRATHMLAKARDTHRSAEDVPIDAKYSEKLLELDFELRMVRAPLEAAICQLTITGTLGISCGNISEKCWMTYNVFLDCDWFRDATVRWNAIYDLSHSVPYSFISDSSVAERSQHFSPGKQSEYDPRISFIERYEYFNRGTLSGAIAIWFVRLRESRGCNPRL
jgi:hypothetical protein